VIKGTIALLPGKQPLDRRLGGPQSWCGYGGGKKSFTYPCREL